MQPCHWGSGFGLHSSTGKFRIVSGPLRRIFSPSVSLVESLGSQTRPDRETFLTIVYTNRVRGSAGPPCKTEPAAFAQNGVART